ncbi:MAG: glycine/betaine ABC transporter substrate-binding protein [Planctomycetes bacterium]|nr:glycine/betaine ABC transporter substrate-binding protein [Planctomycetota bacterium]
MSNRGKIVVAAIVLLAVAAAALYYRPGGSARVDRTAPVVRVGSKDFTESLVVGELYALALEDAGYQVKRMLNIAGSVVHTSITNNQIDLYPEYTGTGLLTILKMDMMTDPTEVYNTVKREYGEKFNLVWLDQSRANDSQGLVIKTPVARQYGIATISDLQRNAENIRFASQGEFDQRDDGMPGLERVYGPFPWKSSKVYDNGLKYQVLLNDEADLAPAYTTEGQLVNTDDFTLLEDDKQMWPPYYLAPVVRNELLQAHPDIAGILNAVSAALDTETMTRLNAEVDVGKREVDAVAKEFFESIKRRGRTVA